MFFNKKSSLELSIRTIVVVVLALTLLGLGLTFIRSMFADISETTLTVQDQIKQQILDDLRRGDKKLSFPTTEVQIENGKSKNLAVGVKNTETQDLDFNVRIYEIIGDTTADVIQNPPEAGSFIWDESTQTLAVSEANVYPIKFNADSNFEGTTIIKVVVEYPDQSEYASKSFFITVV